MVYKSFEFAPRATNFGLGRPHALELGGLEYVGLEFAGLESGGLASGGVQQF